LRTALLVISENIVNYKNKFSKLFDDVLTILYSYVNHGNSDRKFKNQWSAPLVVQKSLERLNKKDLSRKINDKRGRFMAS
jgi:hypothetical protein